MKRLPSLVVVAGLAALFSATTLVHEVEASDGPEHVCGNEKLYEPTEKPWIDGKRVGPRPHGPAFTVAAPTGPLAKEKFCESLVNDGTYTTNIDCQRESGCHLASLCGDPRESWSKTMCDNYGTCCP